MDQVSRWPESALPLLVLILFTAIGYALGLSAGTVLARVLGKSWRRVVEAHWSERARLAFAPGYALLWLAVVLPPVVAIVGGAGLDILDPRRRAGVFGLWLPWLGALTGVLTARYSWVRELWGTRVTVRSWLAGCLVLLLVLTPHILIPFLLLWFLPETPSVHTAAVMGGGVLGMAFFASGGGVMLLRFLGVVRSAPPQVTEMVTQLAAEMKVPDRVKVFELEWAQVNALAWPLYRAVGFTRPLLEVMAQDEVRAVAAHELGHLLEPQWVRVVRVVHMFAYLVVPLVMKYCGASGLLAGWLLFLAIAFVYRRFTRRMEERADRLEREAIADTSAYMRSMIKLHEVNCLPAVMPGAQTHPHLYDRLLAGGIQPDFPRPKAPTRTKPLLAVFAAAITAAGVLFSTVVALSLSQQWMKARPSAPTAALPSQSRQEVPESDSNQAGTARGGKSPE